MNAQAHTAQTLQSHSGSCRDITAGQLDAQLVRFRHCPPLYAVVLDYFAVGETGQPWKRVCRINSGFVDWLLLAATSPGRRAAAPL
jgi:hypothetical protein